MESLDRDNQTGINLQDVEDFGNLPAMPLEMYRSDTDTFNLSNPEMSQLPLHSPFSPFPDMIQDTADYAQDGDNSKPSSGRDSHGWNVDELGAESSAGSTGLTEEQRQQLSAYHGLTSEEVESQLTSFLQPGSDPMQMNYQPDLELLDSSNPGDPSSRGGRSRRTTITMDNIAPETLVTVMQVLINANAKVRFETE